MKYKHGFGVRVPYLLTMEDGSVERNYAMLSTNDPVDRRAIKTILRGWVWRTLQRRLHPIEMRAIIKAIMIHKEPMQYMHNRRVATEEEVRAQVNG